ncbi:uncharacterized protein [Littorina saxatilis]|uniref:uncharacterized protein n=1 Tax=Littorina saxatilis TaxID=31220 RepID=UPI0038B55EDB
MNWTITDVTGSPIQIAYCRKNSYSSEYECIAIDSDINFERNASLGRLTINNYTRHKFVNKLLTCIRRDGDKWDSCKIRVVYPAEGSKPNVSLSSWNLLGTIMINKIYDSYNDVVCWWRVTDPALREIFHPTIPTLFSFLGSDGRQYYNGTCTVSLPLNASDGVHHLELIVLPGGERLLYVGNVSLEKPGDLQLEPQICPVIVAEGSSLECKCHHAKTERGSPPALITWLNDDNSSVLNISNVNKGLNGTEYTCRSEWGPTADLTKTLNYVLLVAYGPTSANVTSQINRTNMTATLTLTCTSDEVYPSANFSWSVPCVTLDMTSLVSTCEVSTGTLMQVTEVTCTAYNSEIPSLTTSAAYTPPAANLNQNEGLSLASVAGGVVAALVIGTIIVVVIIIVKRKREHTFSRENCACQL